VARGVERLLEPEDVGVVEAVLEIRLLERDLVS
jgi:hypothetical protein